MVRIRSPHPLLLAVIVLSSIPAGPASADAALPSALPPALVLLDRDPADIKVAATQIRMARQRLESAWRIVDASSLAGLAWPEPSCDRGSREQRAAKVLQGLGEGTRLFYDLTDVDGARGALQAAMDSFLEAPCVFADDSRGRSEATAGAVLLLRLHLLAGRPEAAADLGRRLLRTFGTSELASVDVPPEVSEFLERIREDSAAALVSLDVALVGNSPESIVLVDGRVLASGTPSVMVAPGAHVVTVIAGGIARTRRVAVEGPDRVKLDLALSSVVHLGPEGSLVAAAPAEQAAGLAGRLSALTGATVVRLSGVGGAGLVEASVVADPAGHALPGVVLRMEGAGGPGSVAVTATGPLARRKFWPWPWVTGAATAGFLAAGIVLNVQANQAADAVNAGSNRLEEWRVRKAGSIAFYALAAAAGAGTIVLAVLGRPMREQVVVLPLSGGAVATFQGSF